MRLPLAHISNCTLRLVSLAPPPSDATPRLTAEARAQVGYLPLSITVVVQEFVEFGFVHAIGAHCGRIFDCSVLSSLPRLGLFCSIPFLYLVVCCTARPTSSCFPKCSDKISACRYCETWLLVATLHMWFPVPTSRIVELSCTDYQMLASSVGPMDHVDSLDVCFVDLLEPFCKCFSLSLLSLFI